MDRREMEKLMDRYKKEMLEFSKRNSGFGSGAQDDERVKEMQDEYEKSGSIERDRSDPLPTRLPEAENEQITPPQTQAEEPETVAVQLSIDASDVSPPINETIDVAVLLRDNCARIAANPNANAEEKERCRDINDYLSENTESGTLRVETFASDRAFGVGGARVMVFLPLNSGNITLFDGVTDVNGVSRSVKLPAPPKEFSLEPLPQGSNRLPYSVYTIYVEHPSYVRAIFSNVPVFSGIESIQPVRMLAKVPGLQEPEPIVVDQSENNTL